MSRKFYAYPSERMEKFFFALRAACGWLSALRSVDQRDRRHI